MLGLCNVRENYNPFQSAAHKLAVAPVLSHDVFHTFILPDLLSEYIHHFLVNSSPPKWNPFRTLPLVSSYFYDSCRELCRGIFGAIDYEEM